MRLARSFFSLFEANPFDTAHNHCESPDDTGCDACNTGARRSSIALWIVIFLLLGCAAAFDKSFPFYQISHPQDLRYHYPYLKETFPSTLCFIVGGIVPLALLVIPTILATAQVANITNTQRTHIPSFGRSRPTSSDTHESDPNSAEETPPLARSRSVTHATTLMPSSSGIPSSNNASTSASFYSPVSLLKAFFSVGIISFTGILSAPSGALGLCLSLALSTCIVTVIKTYVGRPRPNAIALSMYKYDKQAQTGSAAKRTEAERKKQSLLNCITQMRCEGQSSLDFPDADPFAYSTSIPLAHVSPALLTRALAVDSPLPADNTAPLPISYTLPPSMSPHLINEALRSFPSGHASFAFSGFLFLSLVLFSRYKELMRILTGHKQRATQRPTFAESIATSAVSIHDLSIINPGPTPQGSPSNSMSTAYTASSSRATFGINLSSFLAPFFPVPTSSPPFWTPNCDHAYVAPPISMPNSPSAPLPSANAIYSPKSHALPLFTRQIPLHTQILPLPIAIALYLVVPILMASVIAASRVVDYWHHPDDVLAGATLGGLCAVVAYKAVHYHDNDK